MELLAVIDGLRAIKKEGIPVTVYSDSKYVVEAVEKGWLWNWERKNFKDKKNIDLWQIYISLHKIFRPSFVWIKGHNNHPQNERCDQLAVEAARGYDLETDEFYEQLKD
jgi:ribonuclease HI